MNVLCRVVLPTSSMSGVRTHFCTEVARGYGGGASPRKYGLNCTMPALTNSRFGSSRISGALGTRVWPLLSKWRRKRSVISCVSTGVSPCAGTGERGDGGGGAASGSRGRDRSALRPASSPDGPAVGGVPAGRLGRHHARPLLDHVVQLLLSLAHAGAHLGAERTHGARQLAHGVAQVRS